MSFVTLSYWIVWLVCFCILHRYIFSYVCWLILCYVLRLVFKPTSLKCEIHCCMLITLQHFTRSSAIDEGPRDASCQLKSCQLPRNSAETTYTTSPDRIDGIKLEILSEAMRDRQCALNHDATESAPIVSRVINKPTTVELCISPVYRRHAVAKFSKSTM